MSLSWSSSLLYVVDQEWWVHSTNLSSLVTNVSSYSDGSDGDGWRRPYLEQTKWAGCTALGISPGGAAAPPGFLLTHAPLALPGIKNVVPPDAMMSVATLALPDAILQMH